MRRALLILSAILSAVLIALAVAPAATAAAPIREEFPPFPDFVLNDCGFPVLIHSIGTTIVTTYTDNGGNVVRQALHFPGNKQVLTNLETGTSHTYNTSGPAFFYFNPDGSGTFTIVGPSVFLPHPVTGQPGIFWFAGQYVETFDANGNTTSVDFNGHIVDVCADLAAA